jgi:hypothetical protein
MNKKELEDWRTQNATSKEDKQGLRYALFDYLKQLLNPPAEPRPRVGFRRAEEKD